MDNRLIQLLQSGKIGGGNLYLLDTYNQAVHEDVSCTIRTNINTANLHFIFERMSEIKYIRQMSSSQNSRVIDPEGISYAVTNGHKDGEPKIIERDTPMKGNYTEPRICTMVGRDPNNPSSRARSDHYEQFLEMGDDVSNTLTSVQKDNLLAEPIIIDDYNQRAPQDQDVIGTVTTQFGNPAPRHGYKIAEPLRIPQATKQGYIEVPPGSVFDASYPDSKTRSGRVQEGGQVSPTLMAGGETTCYYEGVKTYKNEERILFEEHNKTNSGKILCLLQQKVGKETYEWAIGRFRCILKEEILRCRMYEESICETREQKSIILSSSSFFKEDSISYSEKTDDVRDMWLHKEYRCTSQGYELSEQFSREFNDIVQKLSLENTSSEKLMSYLWRTCIMSIPLQQTLLEVEKIWESIGSKPQVSFRIRKLTEREVFRLMGVSESDIDKIQASGVSRSQQYKMAGNSIVVDVLEHIFRKMFIDTGQESQQLSLF